MSEAHRAEHATPWSGDIIRPYKKEKCMIREYEHDHSFSGLRGSDSWIIPPQAVRVRFENIERLTIITCFNAQGEWAVLPNTKYTVRQMEGIEVLYQKLASPTRLDVPPVQYF